MTRIVVISDTHGMHMKMPPIPGGDILIHAGDFGVHGNIQDCVIFFGWFSAQPHKHKIFIAGNHDVWMEKASDIELAVLVPPNTHYLNDSGCEVEGIKFWGSPVQPIFCNWAFNRERGEEIRQHWDLIPDGTDVLITHGPPRNKQDKCLDYDGVSIVSVGCTDLSYAVRRVKPALHVFGHVHYSYGDCFDNGVTFVNASICNENYAPVNKPYVVDIIGKNVKIITNEHQ